MYKQNGFRVDKSGGFVCGFIQKNYTRFIWDEYQAMKASKLEWFEVHQLDKGYNESERSFVPKLFSVDPQFIQDKFFTWNGLVNMNEFVEYVNNRTLRNDMVYVSNMFATAFSQAKMYKARKIAKLVNVFSNRFGVFVDEKSCRSVRNGGCYYSEAPFHYEFFPPPVTYPIVITLSCSAAGHWHFPMVSIVYRVLKINLFHFFV